jgi:hypothetical protein
MFFFQPGRTRNLSKTVLPGVPRMQQVRTGSTADNEGREATISRVEIRFLKNVILRIKTVHNNIQGPPVVPLS